MAPTGSGKTLCYILPILHLLKEPSKNGIRALVVSPTRELAQQIYREFKKMTGNKKFRMCVLTKATSNPGSITTRNFGIPIYLFSNKNNKQ